MSAPKRHDVKEETSENTRISKRRLVPLNQKERQPGEPASSSRDNRRSGTPLPPRRDYPSREASADSNVTSENTRRRERSMSYGREARQPFRDWASLITSEELERAKERLHRERKWDYSFMCALYKITNVVEQGEYSDGRDSGIPGADRRFRQADRSLCQALHSHARRGCQY